MKLRIESDGTWKGTKVLDAETGEQLENVTGVHVRLPRHDKDVAVAKIELIAPELILVADSAPESADLLTDGKGRRWVRSKTLLKDIRGLGAVNPDGSVTCKFTRGYLEDLEDSAPASGPKGDSNHERSR